ncbi:MAG: hypothetical protein WA981_03685 [Glaciecola sp.]
MKATILVRDLVKLIAKHGDLDVCICVDTDINGEFNAELKSVDESASRVQVVAFELYGEEK